MHPNSHPLIIIRSDLKVNTLELAAIGDRHRLRGPAAGGPHLLRRPDNLHPLHHLAEDDMLAVEPRRLLSADEELRSVGTGAGVGHGEDAGTGMLPGEVLVGELVAVYGLAAGAVSGGEVAALAHEARDHAVEGGSLVVEGLAAAAGALLASAQRAEVLCGAWDHVGEQLHHDAARWGAADRHVEEDPGVGRH